MRLIVVRCGQASVNVDLLASCVVFSAVFLSLLRLASAVGHYRVPALLRLAWVTSYFRLLMMLLLAIVGWCRRRRRLLARPAGDRLPPYRGR